MVGAMSLLLVTALSVSVAEATQVSYTVGGWGPQQFPGPFTPTASSPHGPDGYPGDTIEFAGYTGSLTLPDGPVGTQTQLIQKINTLLWTVDYTYGGTDTWDPWPDIHQPFSTSRGITVGGAPADALSQGGELLNNWYYDYLGLSGGTTTTIYTGTWKIEITPLSLPQVKMNNWSGSAPWTQNDRDVMAQFDITVVPEPAALTLLAIGTLALVRRRRA